MSQPKRYSEQVNTENDFEIVEHPHGEYVLYSDYAAIAAENERLRKAGDAMADDLRDCQADEDNKLLVDWLAAEEGRDAK